MCVFVNGCVSVKKVSTFWCSLSLSRSLLVGAQWSLLKTLVDRPTDDDGEVSATPHCVSTTTTTRKKGREKISSVSACSGALVRLFVLLLVEVGREVRLSASSAVRAHHSVCQPGWLVVFRSVWAAQTSVNLSVCYSANLTILKGGLPSGKDNSNNSFTKRCW